MNKKIFSKVLAIMLVITLTFANFMYLAVYAVSVNYEQQETNINKTDVNFDAYFVSEEGVKTHTKTTEMNNNELKLFLSVSVTSGYLKDAVVSVNNANFKLVSQELPSGVESIDLENNTVTLNQINKGETREIELQIEVIKDERFNLDNFSKDAEIKLTGTFINNSAKEIKAEKSIIVNLTLSENAESYLATKISKYSIFEEDDQRKALLQLTILSNVQNNLLPVKSAEINVVVPTLFGIEPESVDVTSSSTKATNGDDGTEFSADNYSYTDGIISLVVLNNADENNSVAWVKDSMDEYTINLIYSLGDIEKKDGEIEISANSKLSLYNNEKREIKNEVNGKLELPKATESVVSYSINDITKEVAKGYMLVENSANTEYKQEIKVNIGHYPTINNIEINKDSEYYSDENGKVYTATTYYKQITMSKENLLKILGENGTVQLISNGVTLAILDKDTTSYEFEEEISDLMLVISQPIANGTLKIETDKYIKSAEYNETIVNKINKLTNSITGKARFVEEKASTELTLVEPTFNVSSSISNSNLSSVVENKNVEIRVTLQTNNNTNKLFKNPKVEIELPSYIKEVNVNAINILYNDELKAKAGDITTNSAENKVISIELEGEQTKFNDVSSVEGTTLIIGTDLTVDKTAPSITEKMNVRVTNNNKEIIETSSNINYMAPMGIITLNSMSGYNDTEEEITSISGEEEVGKLDVDTKSKVATETITVVNNYNYTCGNISILGRTPTEGNKSLATQDDLGSTFTAKMASPIKAVEGIDNESMTVYYSENENATNNLSNNSNGWTTDLSQLENVKSYLVTLEPEMAKGNKIVLDYDVEIPEKLSRQESTYGVYQVSYTNLDGALKGSVETIQAPVVGISTGNGPELKVELSADVENGAKVKEGQRIEYTIKVTNIGKAPVNDVTVKGMIPDGSYYTYCEPGSTTYSYIKDASVKEYTDKIDSIDVGESVEKKFLLTVGTKIEEQDLPKLQEKYPFDITEDYMSTDVKVSATATAYDEDEPFTFTSNEMVNEKEKVCFNLVLEKKDAMLVAGKVVEYELNIEKWEINDLHNLEITWEIPNGLTYNSSVRDEELIKETIQGSKVKWNVDTLSDYQTITLFFTINEIKEDKTVSLKMKGTCDEFDGIRESNTETFLLGVPKLEISHVSNNTTGNVTEGDKIIYTISVKNNSVRKLYNVKITDYLSDGLFAESLKYTLGDKIQTYGLSGTTVNFTMDIPENETLTIELKATVQELEAGEEEKTVSNRFEVQVEDIDKISSNTIEHKVNKIVYKVDDNDQLAQTGSISGLAWLDENANGTRETNEQLLAEIPVILINESGATISSNITDENGAYIFGDLPLGNYIVVFLYDLANYDVTTYAIGESTNNNDVVAMNVNIDGVDTLCGATNAINLTSNVYNIDLGLVANPKFDLGLTKTISKVTVQTSKATKTTNYNNSKLQKVEIESKYLEGAVVAVEYTITVTNNGAISGYASRIVDYLSSTDLKFNSETNPDWYLGTDGNLYNSTLKNTLLHPGESATLKLVLTKQVSESNTGLTNNTAEIYEAYNDEGIQDYNSTPGNKAQSENDLGQADVMIGPKTGVVLYIGSVILFMSIIAVGIYVLNKKVIKKI